MITKKRNNEKTKILFLKFCKTTELSTKYNLQGTKGSKKYNLQGTKGSTKYNLQGTVMLLALIYVVLCTLSFVLIYVVLCSLSIVLIHVVLCSLYFFWDKSKNYPISFGLSTENVYICIAFRGKSSLTWTQLQHDANTTSPRHKHFSTLTILLHRFCCFCAPTESQWSRFFK